MRRILDNGVKQMMNVLKKSTNRFRMPKSIWKARELTTKTEIVIFYTNVKSVPAPCGSETWEIYENIII